MTLFDAPDPPRPRRRWIPRCDDCGRRIWSVSALRRRFGLLLGGKCYRKRASASRRLTLRIRVTSPGHIPGQLTIDQEQT